MKAHEIVHLVLGCLSTPEPEEVKRLNERLARTGINATVTIDRIPGMDTIKTEPLDPSREPKEIQHDR